MTALLTKGDYNAGSVPADVDLIGDLRAAERGGAAATRLEFAVDAEGRTYLERQFATYPHHLTRVHYLDRDARQAATVYLQSLSGGLTQGDRVVLHVATRAAAVAHVTTQSATKVHTMDRGFASQQTNLDVLDDSHLEFIADPTICFPRSRLVVCTALSVAPTASAIIADSYLWHDPRGGGDDMAFGALSMETAIRRPDGHLVALDRSRLSSARDLLGNPALFGSYRALGTLFAVGRGAASDASLTTLRAALEPLSGIYAGVSRLPADAGLWLRVLAVDGAALRAALDCTWRQCHQQMLGWPCERRRK